MTKPSSQPAGPTKVIQYETLEEGLAQLPNYTRSLLKVRLPLSVNLASCKRKVSQVLKLGHGSIIEFEKGFDMPLEMEVGGVVIALGEAVKVGEKFGLRISSIKLPDERFKALEQIKREAS
jgi:flagellar motor switch/type III secretory pathway protein FliN